jgi:hypothetical protein
VTYVLWTIQGLLAALFLFAGGAKLIMSADQLKGPVEIPVLFLRFIAVCELLGGLGLILPGLLRVKTGLTPLAAVGLTIIMIGATVMNLKGGDPKSAAMTVVAALLAAFVAYGRWRPASRRRSSEASALQHAR